MQLTQSYVSIPERRLEDWYTLTGEKLGEGGFATVEKAYDDRECLLYLRYLSEHTPEEIENLQLIPEDLRHLHWQDYWDTAGWPESPTLITESPSQKVIDENVKSWQELAYYLSAFDTKSLKTFFNLQYSSSSSSSDVVSRFELIFTTCGNYARTRQIRPALIGRDEMQEQLFFGSFVSRPMVAVKKMMAISDEQKTRFERATKTEVFGLGRVSSETPIEMRVFNQSSKNSPVGCAVATFEPLASQVLETPSTITTINCLEDYFYTPESPYTYNLQTYYIILSFTKGMTLYSLLKKIRKPINPRATFAVPTAFPGHFTWYVAWVMAHALKRTHEDGHIIHNDVKLENIMYDRELGAVTLIDYGLSCHLNIGNRQIQKMDKCDAIGGTASYGSAEMFRLGLRYPGSDIWALGVTLWEMAMGKPYSPGGDVIEMRDNIVSGARPNVNQILHSMPFGPFGPHETKFIEMLSWMFQLQVQDRPTASEIIDFITRVFSGDALGVEYDRDIEQVAAVGNYLYRHGNADLENLLTTQRNRRAQEELTARFSLMFGNGKHGHRQTPQPSWNPPAISPARRRRSRPESVEEELIDIGFQTPSPQSKRQHLRRNESYENE